MQDAVLYTDENPLMYIFIGLGIHKEAGINRATSLASLGTIYERPQPGTLAATLILKKYDLVFTDVALAWKGLGMRLYIFYM